MMKRIWMCVAAAGVLMALGYAKNAESAGLTIQRTDPTDGKQMYMSYCASCHGADARGNGPVASALKTPPTDLTLMARANNGKYPDTHVYSVLAFGSAVPSHGTAGMPVWGTLLAKIDQGHPSEPQLRISNLSRYLQSIQAK